MTTETPNTANGGTQSRAEGGAAGADLDGLLNEFENPNPGAAQPRAADTSVLKALKPVIDFANTEMNARAKAALDNDIKSAVSFVQEDEAAKAMPPRFVRGFLEGYAAENETFAQAFQNRQKDPATWQKQLGEARGAFLEEIKTLPGNTVKSDVEAARAAVSGRSEPVGDKSAPSAVELVAMPQRDFDALVSKQIAANETR